MKSSSSILSVAPDRRRPFDGLEHDASRWPFRYSSGRRRRPDRSTPAQADRTRPAGPEDEAFNPGALGNALSQLRSGGACAAGHEPYLIFEDDAACAAISGGTPSRSSSATSRRMHMIAVRLQHRFGHRLARLRRLSFGNPVRRDGQAPSRLFRPLFAPAGCQAQPFQCLQFWGMLAYAISPSGRPGA